MKICKKCNASNINDAKRCNQCGAKLPGKIYPDTITTAQQPKKRNGCLIAAIVIFIIVALFIVFVFVISSTIGSSRSSNENSSVAESTPTVQVVFDASSYDNISKTELENILGAPSSQENWTNEYGYEMLICDYTQDGQYLSFFIYNDTVVKMYYYPDAPCTYSGNIDKDASGMFGFGTNAEMYFNNNITKKYYLELESSTKEIEIYDVYEDKHQFGYAYIEFDHRYFS